MVIKEEAPLIWDQPFKDGDLATETLRLVMAETTTNIGKSTTPLSSSVETLNPTSTRALSSMSTMSKFQTNNPTDLGSYYSVELT